MTLGYALTFVLIGHVFADFYAQTDFVARQKCKSMRVLTLHCGVYALCLIPFCLVSFSFLHAVAAWVVLAFAHAVIDFGKVAWERRHNKLFAIYCLDQALHMFVCFAVAAVFFDGQAMVDITSSLIAARERSLSRGAWPQC